MRVVILVKRDDWDRNSKVLAVFSNKTETHNIGFMEVDFRRIMVYTDIRCDSIGIPRKAVGNRQKHGVSFDDAITAFDDPFALIERDEEHSTRDE